MMLNDDGDRLIPLREVPRLPGLPRRRGGARLHLSTLYRWWKRGINGVRLKVVKFGGVPCTTETSLVEFFERLGTAADQPAPETTSAKHRRDQAAADRLLDSAGI